MDFKKGDFIKNKSNDGHFYIYVGDKVKTKSYYYGTSYSVALEYLDKHYTRKEDGTYTYEPKLKFNGKDGILGIDYDNDRWVYDKMSESEKNEAIKKIEDFGYSWDDTSHTLYDMDSGEIIFQIKQPSLDYHHELVRLINQDRMTILIESCQPKETTTTSYGSGYGSYPSYGANYAYDDDDYYCYD